MRINYITSLLLLVFGFLNAQQEPQYTQYMYNMSIVNPGYMMDELGLVEVGSLYRTQWVGIDGAPKTANVFANIPLNDKIELSINYLNDYIGDPVNMSENQFNVDAAYRILLKNGLNMSFGLKAGFDHLNFSALGSNVGNDPLFQNSKKTVLNIGAGVFAFKEQYYIGFSAPNLIPTEINSNDGIVYKDDAHLFLIGGYVFTLNNSLKLKPSTVVKYVSGAPLSFDVSANALLHDRFELGLSYRYQDAIAGLIGIYVTRDLRLGYAYDYNTSGLKNYNSGSHEFILIYRFDVLGIGRKYISPRFY